MGKRSNVKIISGGQIGANIAGLRAAKELGFETGGWMSLGFKTLEGNKPEYAEMYGLRETEVSTYPQRTELNVLSSDGTLRIAKNFSTRGELCTIRAIKKYNKPYYDLNYFYIEKWFQGASLGTAIITWILENNIQILNIAGNALVEIESITKSFLVSLFKENENRLKYS